MKKTLLVLAAVVGLGGCVSLKTHREAVKMAEMRGKLEGQDQVLPLVTSCLSVKVAQSTPTPDSTYSTITSTVNYPVTIPKLDLPENLPTKDSSR